METKFTKGEWKIIELPSYLKTDAIGHEIHSNDSNGWICKVQTVGIINNNEGIANAKLIAAAPEMFEALEDALFGLELANKEHPNKGFERSIALIKQAIKKATE